MASFASKRLAQERAAFKKDGLPDQRGSVTTLALDLDSFDSGARLRACLCKSAGSWISAILIQEI